MELSTEQLDYLDKHFDERYDSKFVHVDSCTEKQEANNRKFANDDKRIEMATKDIGLFKKLAWVLVTATVGQFVLSFFELIKNINTV